MKSIYCRNCAEQTDHRVKMGGNVCNTCDSTNDSVYLVREHDGKDFLTSDFRWIRWNEDKTFKEWCDNIEIGCSLILPPYRHNFLWITTKVTEILEENDGYIKFNTENSVYTLYYATYIKEVS